MALIQLDRNNAIKSDSQAWTLCRARHRIDKKNRRRFVTWEPYAYFPSITTAVEGLIDREIRGSEAETIGELATDVAAITARICLALVENLGLDQLREVARSPAVRREFDRIKLALQDPSP